jgi:hypothetical protein
LSSVNLALHKPAVSSSFVLPYSAQKAVDGSISPLSRWQCNINILPGWITIDLGQSYLIDRWVVYHLGAAGFYSPGYFMTDYKLQRSSDNINWDDVDSITGNISTITNRIVAPFYARYVRILVTNGLQVNPQLASIVEFEVYAHDEPQPPSRGIPFFPENS